MCQADSTVELPHVELPHVEGNGSAVDGYVAHECRDNKILYKISEESGMIDE
jgi:hypothetical protein